MHNFETIFAYRACFLEKCITMGSGFMQYADRSEGKGVRIVVAWTKVLFTLGIVLMLLGMGYIIWFPWTMTGTSVVAAAPPSTQVIRFNPSGIRRTLETSADCWETSLAAPRANAWRCIVVNTIYDPCFSVSAQASYVICDADPAGDARGLKVALAHPLSVVSISSEAGTQAWKMRLTDDSVCSFITGASGLVGGERINYDCTNGALIIGFPQRSRIWTVKEMKKGQFQPIMQSVVEAWI
jgi:hypothetical protein